MTEPAYFQCDCHTPYHALVLERDEDVRGSFNVSLVSTKSGDLWHRIKYALRHVFVPEALVEGDIILSAERAAELAAYLTSSEAA